MLNDINTITIILAVALGIFLLLLIILVAVYFSSKSKEKKEEQATKTSSSNDVKKDSKKTYTVESVFDFMDFDKIEDNMISQKNGERYIMVVECQGVNYDLMSEVEKNAVEEGFIQFLNTLRHPIQIYTQTRTVNLQGSISTYKEKINEIKDTLVKTEMEYRTKVNIGGYSREELEKLRLEVVKQRNLYEYGLDIIKNTEQMSFNKNILTKQYYIIIPYYPEDSENKDYDKGEIKNLAFSELYTKAQSIISALYVCGINSKILNSTELAELLYVAYNRDDSEVYDLNKMLNSGYEELYSTAPDVLDKRMKEIDKKIEEDAVKRANQAVLEASQESEKEKAVREKEQKIDKLIDDMAKMIIEENEKLIGQEVAEKAKDKIEKETKGRKGGKEDEQKEKKTTTRRTRKTT